MRRPSPAVLGSVALHLGVAALAFFSWPERNPEDPKPLVSSVPVSIVSETEIAAAAPDNPQPEPSPDNAATAPVQQIFMRDALMRMDTDAAALNRFIAGEIKRWSAIYREIEPQK